jgi:hypothetical protein
MGDERLDELGIPRRSFLKRAGAAAFVAPVVVSFGLEGMAQAHASSFRNQSCGNQTFSNQFGQNQQGQNDDCQGVNNNQ